MSATAEGPLILLIGPFDAPFLRGDADDDGTVELSDAVKFLRYLFLGDARPHCLDAADANDDGSLDLCNPIGLLSQPFLDQVGAKEPGTPIPCPDPTPDDLYCIDGE